MGGKMQSNGEYMWPFFLWLERSTQPTSCLLQKEIVAQQQKVWNAALSDKANGFLPCFLGGFQSQTEVCFKQGQYSKWVKKGSKPVIKSGNIGGAIKSRSRHSLLLISSTDSQFTTGKLSWHATSKNAQWAILWIHQRQKMHFTSIGCNLRQASLLQPTLNFAEFFTTRQEPFDLRHDWGGARNSGLVVLDLQKCTFWRRAKEL